MQLCVSLSILWHCLSLGLEWKLTFSSPVATAELSKFADILSAALSQHQAHLCMKCSLGISNFLEEISSLFHSIVFLYSFALITEEGSHLSLLFFGTLHSSGYLSFSPLLFPSLLFTAICKASSDNHFAFLHFFFLGMVLIPISYTMPWTSIHSSSGTLSIRSRPLNLFLTSTYSTDYYLSPGLPRNQP